MTKEELFDNFKILFPNWKDRVVSYKKIGSKSLAIKIAKYITKSGAVSEDCDSRVFLYENQNNWQFGTKLWRKRPERKKKKENK